MNLFVIGWNCNTKQRTAALDALRDMHQIFPLLDPDTLGAWHGSRAFAAWMHSGEEAIQPRRYVHRIEHGLVLYDGTPVNASRRFSAHDAAQLGEQWDSLPEQLEGQFVVARIKGPGPETLELLNDPLGIWPVYVHNGGSHWLISNSVRLLARVAGITSIDEEAVAIQLQRGSPGGNHTLVRNISAVPAGQRWRWAGNFQPTRTTYAAASDLALLPKRSFGASEALTLADALGNMLSVLAEVFGEPQCPITAGRDSRMMVGLLMARGLSADYFTEGDPDDIDMQRGSAIADRFHFRHRKIPGKAEALAAAWDDACRRVIQQHDGLVTLMHARNALERPERVERIPIHLYGAGGEHARGHYFGLRFVLRRPSLACAITETTKHFAPPCPLVHPDTRQILVEYIERTCRSLHDQGFAPVDIPDAFDVTEENRRWAGAQAHQIVEVADVFSPFLTRPYIRAAFATPPAERLMERIPYELLGHLSPELRAMPAQQPWPSQTITGLVLQRLLVTAASQYERLQRRLRHSPAAVTGRTRDRLLVLESLLQRSRERYLDQSNSVLWQMIDRNGFASLSSDRATASERLRAMQRLYMVATMFEFEEDLAAWVRRPTEGIAHPGYPLRRVAG